MALSNITAGRVSDTFFPILCTVMHLSEAALCIFFLVFAIHVWLRRASLIPYHYSGTLQTAKGVHFAPAKWASTCPTKPDPKPATQNLQASPPEPNATTSSERFSMPMQPTTHNGWEQASTCARFQPLPKANLNYRVERVPVSAVLRSENKLITKYQCHDRGGSQLRISFLHCSSRSYRAHKPTHSMFYDFLTTRIVHF